MRISILKFLTAGSASLLLSPSSLSLAYNLNYLSPSTNHPQYGIPGHSTETLLNTLTKRDPSPPSLQKRGGLTWDIRFTHGIASGDPYSDSVILWARAVPKSVDADAHQYSSSSPDVCVQWQVATSDAFTEIVTSGSLETGPQVDYTIKALASGLQPWRYYWYRFISCDGVTISAVGRTKTLPAPDDELKNSSVRLSVVSCSNYAEGFFNVYGMSARKDSVDYVLHLGDYIYEMPFPTTNPHRIPRPLKETIQLVDYRQRFAVHRTDADLLLSHSLFPWLTIWDDHEVANNGWRSGSSASLWRILETTTWDTRLHSALRAYFEWMPLRQVNASDSLRIYRSFKLGTLADLVLLDTRYDDRDSSDPSPELAQDPDRSIMGVAQEHWLDAQLAENSKRGATWMVLANQVQLSNINETAIPSAGGALRYYDGWSGYTVSRARLLDSFERHKVANPVVLTGDYHVLWTAELAPDSPGTGPGAYNWTTGSDSLGIELAVTAVTSSSGYGDLSYDDSQAVAARLVRENQMMKWGEGYYRGYFELTLTREELEARYFAVPNVETRDEVEKEIAVWRCKAGEKRFERPLPEVKEGRVQVVVEEWAVGR